MWFTDNVLAKISIPGVTVWRSDSWYPAGQRLHNFEDGFVVSFRNGSAKLPIAAQLTNGDVQEFGQVGFLPPGIEVRTTAADTVKITRNVRCRFSPDYFHQLWQAPYQWEKVALSKCLDIHSLRIEEIMRQIDIELHYNSAASSTIIESLANILVIEIARFFENDDQASRMRTHQGRLSSCDVKRIYELIDAAEERCLTTKDIAQACGISYSNLRRSFQNTTGASIHDIRVARRLQRAMNLLANTDLPLKAISHQLGFANASAFSSTFVRETSLTPSNYRRRHRAH